MTLGADDLRRHLAELSAVDRRRDALALSSTQQAELWRSASADQRRPEGELVPGTTAVYLGRNSLRLFSHFEKWFARQGDQVVGCNRHALSALIGPGYFTVSQQKAAELEFDYSQVPPVAPADWPAVKRNSGPFARQVYGDLLDHVVWVTADVLVGAAFRRGTPLDSYFILVRKPDRDRATAPAGVSR